MHDEAAGTADSRIDLNRAGTPLLEIVTQPDLRSPAEAKTFLTELKLLLTYLGVSDCNMQEGSLRVDGNINLHLHATGTGPGAVQGHVATPIVEVKNMNSFRAVERAMAYEAGRQLADWQETGQRMGPNAYVSVPKQTRGWDDAAGVTHAQRHKEESHDYRYFPDPDLVPVRVSVEQAAQVRTQLGELPAALRQRLQTTFGISAYDADVLVNQGRDVVDYYLDLAARTGDGKLAANWVTQSVLRTLNERQLTIADYPVSADRLAELLGKVQAGELDTSRGRQVLEDMLASGRSAEAAMRQLGIVKVDESELEALCRELVAANPKAVADIRAGNAKAAAAFIGQAKKRNPNVDPRRVQEICLRLVRADVGGERESSSIAFTQEALEDLREVRKFDQQRIIAAIEDQLAHQSAIETRNRKRLRPNQLAEWELRVGRFRVFYDVDTTLGVVKIVAVGYKEGSALFVHGERYDL